jgi:hypothetical protein
MSKRKILIQLDSDPQPSVFDRVVAVDAGVEELFSYGGVTPEQVRTHVQGAIFTRGPDDLKCTALFIGGSDVTAGEKLLQEAVKSMLPEIRLRVSVLLDSNGANTTAAAAVRAAAKHVPLAGAQALVLAGTGPVGQRVALLLAREGAAVRLASRQLAKASGVVETLRARVPGASFEPVAPANNTELAAALSGCALVFGCGTGGVQLLPRDVRTAATTLKIAIDLNAVKPVGIEGIKEHDRGAERDGVIAYGALGVGHTKMKLHKAAIAKLFESNDQVLDAAEVYALSASL